MNLHHLELFYHVAKHRGISAAARHIPYGIQQPAISSQILQLEAALNTTLFHRRPFQLTREGEMLFGFVDPFFSGLPDLHDRLTAGQGERLRIAAPELVQREYLPTLLARIRLKRKNFRFSLVDARQEQIEQALLRQEVDLGLALQTHPSPAGVAATPVLKLGLTLLVPAKLGITCATELLKSVERISIPLITLTGSDTIRHLFLEELRRRSVSWIPSLELSSLDLVTRYAAQGFGVGLSVNLARVKLPKTVIELPLSDFPEATFSLFHPSRPSALIELLIEECRIMAAELYGQTS